MKRIIISAATLAAIGASLALGGCADDGYYDRGYTSMSFGVSSGGGYGYRDGYYGNRSWRDRDGDGVPNKYDSAPDNPNRR